MIVDRRRRLQASLLVFGQALLYALMPKCPLCVAAALSICGLSASTLAPWMRPLVLLLGAASLFLLARSFRQRRACCAH